MRYSLGPLINAMNPYSNPLCARPVNDGADDVTVRMQPVVARPLPEGVAVADASAAQLVARLVPEIDNYQGGEWSFMGQMYKIKRSLLIPYRYQVRTRDGGESGVWAIGRLLIGYTGANG